MKVIAFNNARKPRRLQAVEMPRHLTPREAQVVSMTYLTNAAIAEDLGISIRTVHALLRSAFIKLAADTRTQAYAIWAEQQDVKCVPPPSSGVAEIVTPVFLKAAA